MFESAEAGSRVVNATDRRFFWLSMYVAPALWVGLAVLALVRLLNAIWLVIVGELIPGPSLERGCCDCGYGCREVGEDEKGKRKGLRIDKC